MTKLLYRQYWITVIIEKLARKHPQLNENVPSYVLHLATDILGSVRPCF